ncbi:hypothetical protein, partial [Methanosarcina acetivorans]|uniref:hypothetical protein n=1 Tax=Methanosarcina acetivorans TaxID=2214 RepID=UPI0024792446
FLTALDKIYRKLDILTILITWTVKLIDMTTHFKFIIILMFLVFLLGYFLSINKLTLILLGASFLLSIIAGVLSDKQRKTRIR